MVTIQEEIGEIADEDLNTKEKMDQEYKVWKIITVIATLTALGIYIIPMFF